MGGNSGFVHMLEVILIGQIYTFGGKKENFGCIREIVTIGGQRGLIGDKKKSKPKKTY